MNLWRGLAIDFTIGAPEAQVGNRRHSVARAETTGYAHSSRRAFDLQQRRRLR
jgi:hypothetical protein